MLATLALLALGTAAASAPERGEARGRVLDAFTGAALAGVRCELWTEAGFEPCAIVATTVSGPDGGFALAGERGAKLVLHRAGYRSTERHAALDEDVLLFPAREAFALRVCDLEGRPIEGALVRTRQSCRHAPPAVEARSDADGRVRIDDLPPGADFPEVEVLAPGRASLGPLRAESVWGLPDLRLPLRRTPRVRWLTQGGEDARAGELRLQGDSGEEPLTPDATGRVALERLFAWRDGVVFLRGAEGEPAPLAPIEALDLPSSGGWTVRFGAPGAGASGSAPAAGRDDAVAPLARLTVHVADPPSGDGRAPHARVRVLHEEGWLLAGPGPHALPAGRAWLVVGAPFSGVCERIQELSLRAGEERRLEVAPWHEPRLRLRVPPGTLWVHVQAGDDSITLSGPGQGEGELVTPVPPAGRVVVLAQDGPRARLAVLAGWSGEASVDLCTDEALALGGSEAAPPAEPLELCFLVRGAEGGALDARASGRAAGEELPDLDPDPARVRLRVPDGARWEASFGAPGHRRLWRTGVATRAAAAAPQEIRLPLLAPDEDDGR